MNGWEKIHFVLKVSCEVVKSLSHVWLFATPWTVAHQAPPSMEFSRQEYWSELPFPSGRGREADNKEATSKWARVYNREKCCAENTWQPSGRWWSFRLGGQGKLLRKHHLGGSIWAKTGRVSFNPLNPTRWISPVLGRGTAPQTCPCQSRGPVTVSLGGRRDCRWD